MNTRRDDSRIVFVIGMARSGTSWIAKALSYDPSFNYFCEPDNHKRVPGAKPPFIPIYLTRDRGDEEYERHIDRAVRGEVSNAFTRKDEVKELLKRTPWLRVARPHLHHLLPKRRNVLLKLIASNYAMERLEARYPQAQLVYIVRHPCGVFSSRKRLGWTPQPERVLKNPDLMRDHLEPYRGLIESASTFWEKAGASWGVLHYVINRQTSPDSRRIFVQYEWLCEDPLPRFQALYRRLGMEWNERVEAFLAQQERHDGRPYSLRRDSREQIAAWQKEVTPEEQEECRRFVEPFNLPYYPEFKPEPAPPKWFLDEAMRHPSGRGEQVRAEISPTAM